MGCATSLCQCLKSSNMSFSRQYSNEDREAQAKFERKLYFAKESPEPYFDLSECALRKVPSGLYSICKVYRKEFIYLQCNFLKNLNGGGLLSDLYLIKVLNLSSNEIEQLPEEIKYLVNLNELLISGNRLTHLPETIKHLQCLQILDVSNNNLHNITSSIGSLKSLKILKIKENERLRNLCKELCFARNVISIELDSKQFQFPPYEITVQGTIEILKFLCKENNCEYIPPTNVDTNLHSSYQLPPEPNFKYGRVTSWEEQESANIEKEEKIHNASKHQKKKFLTEILNEQSVLDAQINKVQITKDIDRQRLIVAIQQDYDDVKSIVNQFIKYNKLKPEILQQQLAYEQSEHDKLLQIVKQNYDNVKKNEVLQSMERLIVNDFDLVASQKIYKDNMNNIKKIVDNEDIESSKRIHKFFETKDKSHTLLVQELLEDSDFQKAIVTSLIEKVDARSWSLNEEISLVSSNLAKLSIIEQNKKKLQIEYNYNDLLSQRMQLVVLLEDLFTQQSKRKKQLLQTIRDIETDSDRTTDFWIKNYQKLIDSAPKNILQVGNHLDPILANCLLQNGVIHCLPFIVKFLFTKSNLSNLTNDMLKQSGISLSTDRENVLHAIKAYFNEKSIDYNNSPSTSKLVPNAPSNDLIETNNFTGVVNDVDNKNVQSSECVICMDAQYEVVFVPCGHMCCCYSCAFDQLKNCPMCRSKVEKVLKVIVS